MAKPYIVQHEQPQNADCTECDDSTPFEHYTVTGPNGPLCENCAWDTGLGDAAHGLSLVKHALIHSVEQHDRAAIKRYLDDLAKFAADLASGATVLYVEDDNGGQRPVRPGGSDPHATVRRHFLRPVGGAK